MTNKIYRSTPEIICDLVNVPWILELEEKHIPAAALYLARATQGDPLYLAVLMAPNDEIKKEKLDTLNSIRGSIAANNVRAMIRKVKVRCSKKASDNS